MVKNLVVVPGNIKLYIIYELEMEYISLIVKYSYINRLWTHGYDFYSPSRAYIGTWYMSKKGELGSWHSNSDDKRKSNERMATLLKFKNSDQSEEAINKLGYYKLGEQRKYQDYVEWCGVNPMNKTIDMKDKCMRKWVPWDHQKIKDLILSINNHTYFGINNERMQQKLKVNIETTTLDDDIEEEIENEEDTDNDEDILNDDEDEMEEETDNESINDIENNISDIIGDEPERNEDSSIIDDIPKIPKSNDKINALKDVLKSQEDLYKNQFKHVKSISNPKIHNNIILNKPSEQQLIMDHERHGFDVTHNIVLSNDNTNNISSKNERKWFRILIIIIIIGLGSFYIFKHRFKIIGFIRKWRKKNLKDKQDHLV